MHIVNQKYTTMARNLDRKAPLPDNRTRSSTPLYDNAKPERIEREKSAAPGFIPNFKSHPPAPSSACFKCKAPNWTKDHVCPPGIHKVDTISEDEETLSELLDSDLYESGKN
ncbi:hypothetical protein OCU04_003543 [Sclerotinia nivalis]|uniref:Uncharacterized protein n=1 Tax=Sclerotinia nivalis TaxID=352851 RepID=A0A9X0AVM4_9HELO|nr:hypothetical protein OCU04_003543 [Sclerotinia nivalis]